MMRDKLHRLFKRVYYQGYEVCPSEAEMQRLHSGWFWPQILLIKQRYCQGLGNRVGLNCIIVLTDTVFL